MKTKPILLILLVVVALLHATFTPILISNHLNKKTVDYTTHYAKGDSIGETRIVIDSLNGEIYE